VKVCEHGLPLSAGPVLVDPFPMPAARGRSWLPIRRIDREGSGALE
jgi:hypothetical protein